MPRHLNIACLQTRPLADFRSALDEAVELAEIAVGSGEEMLALPEERGVVQAVIDLDQVAAARVKIPSLKHDRPFHIGEPWQSGVA